MREVSFSELYTKNFDVSMLVAFNQKWADGQEFYMTKPRKCSALLYFDNCCGKYIFPDNTTFSVKKGDVVYIPKDSVYKTVFLCQYKKYTKTKCFFRQNFYLKNLQKC